VSTIACRIGRRGPLYAGYNAHTQVHDAGGSAASSSSVIEDPSSLPDYHITRFPRFEGEINYLAAWSGDGKFVVKRPGLTQELGN